MFVRVEGKGSAWDHEMHTYTESTIRGYPQTFVTPGPEFAMSGASASVPNSPYWPNPDPTRDPNPDPNLNPKHSQTYLYP